MPQSNLELRRYRYIVLLDIFLLIQSFQTYLNKLIGVPFVILLSFLLLLIMGLYIERLSLIKKFNNFNVKYFKYFLLILCLFNLRQIVFGSYFSLFQDSWFFILILIIPILIFFVPKWIFVSLFVLVLVSTILVIINKFPLNHSGDMLCYIDNSLAMIRNGENPYLKEVHVLGYPYTSLGYMPFLIIPYLPFKLVADRHPIL